MIVLDDNNSYVEPTHLMMTLAVVTTWCSQMDALMMIDDDGFEPLHFMVEPMVQLMHLMIAWSFDGGDGGALLIWWSPCTWWWPWGHVEVDMFCLVTWCTLMEMTCIDVMVAWWVSAMLRMTWFIDGDGIPCLDDMIEMTYLALMCWWRWHTLMTWCALACDEVPYSLTLTFTSPTLALALSILAYPCKTLTHPFLVHHSIPQPFLYPSATITLAPTPCFILTLSFYLS